MKSKYGLACLFFIVWMLFFDQHNLIVQYKLGKTRRTLISEKIRYEHLYEEALVKKEEFEKNKIRFARERYLFKKANEDLYLIK